MIEITNSLTPQQIYTDRDQFVAVYRKAFKAPPYSKDESEVVEFADSLPQHMQVAGFQMVVAIEAQTDELVGFAYGYANLPDQLFHQEVVKVIPANLARDWLFNSFRIVQFAVTPRAQGQGIGGALYDRLLRNVPYEKAILATMAAGTNAYRFYRKRGWRVLLDEIHFPGVFRPYRVMGLELVQG